MDYTSFLDLSADDMMPFALGPVYVYAGVKDDLVEKFKEEFEGRELSHYEVRNSRLFEEKYKLSVRAGVLRFERAIVARCREWNNLLNILDRRSYLHFTNWLLSQQFVDRAAKRFHLPRRYVSPILDPLAMDVLGMAKPVSLDIYCLSGLRGMIRPELDSVQYDSAKTFVDLKVLPPEEDTILLGRTALNIVREA
jgi:hypothetical protein